MKGKQGSGFGRGHDKVNHSASVARPSHCHSERSEESALWSRNGEALPHIYPREQIQSLVYGNDGRFARSDETASRGVGSGVHESVPNSQAGTLRGVSECEGGNCKGERNKGLEKSEEGSAD